MKLFNISQFNNTSDYLPILNAVIITDIIVIILLLVGIINSSVLQTWYRSISLSAVIADVLIIFIGIIITRFIYPLFFSEYKLIYFIFLAVCVQVIHDVLFYLFVIAFPSKKSIIIDIFQRYGKEVGYKAILSDSMMMISSVLIASYLKGESLNINIITLILSIYLIPYLIYSV